MNVTNVEEKEGEREKEEEAEKADERKETKPGRKRGLEILVLSLKFHNRDLFQFASSN